MKKVLFVAHVDSHIRHFHIPYLKYFKEKGYEVHVATSNDENEEFPYCDVKHTICMERKPFKLNNLKAINQMKKLFETEKFDLVHCHTPMGGVVTRFAGKTARKNGMKIFYTAHGFHFYKGAPMKNWIIYYPVEKYLSKITDVLITINHEDYELAKSKFYAKDVRLVHGMGVDDKKFTDEKLPVDEYVTLRNELGLTANDFVMIYVAELIDRKNQVMLIDAMSKIAENKANIKAYLVGNGVNAEKYKEQIEKLGLQNNVIMLGYRKDVSKLLKLADVCVATSKQEGMGLNLIEGLLTGVPVVASEIRGHTEFVQENINGLFFKNIQELIDNILLLEGDKELKRKLAQNARESVKEFSLENALKEQIQIYEEAIN